MNASAHVQGWGDGRQDHEPLGQRILEIFSDFARNSTSFSGQCAVRSTGPEVREKWLLNCLVISVARFEGQDDPSFRSRILVAFEDVTGL